MICGHGGNIYELAERLGCTPGDITDMSSNVNPMGPMPALIDHLHNQLASGISALPEVDARGAVDAFAANHGLKPEQIAAGNGTTQLIYSIPRALGSRKALIMGPTYADYRDACTMNGIEPAFFLNGPDTNFDPDLDLLQAAIDGYDTAFICNPNNPTGRLIPGEDLIRLCKNRPNTRFIIDESYLPFVRERETQSLLRAGLKNVIVLNSMSKIFRIPGLRIGFAVSEPETIERLNDLMLPWSLNSLAQAAVRFLMSQQDKVDAFVRESVDFLDTEKDIMMDTFQPASAITLFPSRTSFILARLNGDKDAHMIWEQLARKRFLIRNCENFHGLSDRYVRVSLKTADANRQLARDLKEIISM